MMNNGSADPIITVTLETADMEDPVVNTDSTTRSLLKSGGPAMGVQKSLSSSKNFWIELPQIVVVETRFITQQIATQSRIYSAQTLLPITDHKNDLSTRKMTSAMATQTAPQPMLVDADSLAKPDLVDVFIATDSPNPCRDRAQQTTKPTHQTAAIGIQCNLEDDLAFAQNDLINDASIERKINEKQKFLRFTREKSIFYINGRRECMVCGEVETSMERMLSHLALHWGPSVLCHLCGLQFEHQTLMLSHNCLIKKWKSKRRQKSYQQCPIFWCGCVKSSPEALTGHIRKHLRIQRRRACVTFTLDRTLVLKRPLVTKNNCLHRCNICLKRCKNTRKFAKHRKRCVESFVTRLKEQQFVKPLVIL